MKRLTLILGLFFVNVLLFSGCKKEGIRESDLYETDDGITYYENRRFTGVAFIPNDGKKGRWEFQYDDGYLIEFKQFYPSGHLQRIQRYDKNGNTVSDEEFNDY
jgi:hypothetical protein